MTDVMTHGFVEVPASTTAVATDGGEEPGPVVSAKRYQASGRQPHDIDRMRRELRAGCTRYDTPSSLDYRLMRLQLCIGIQVSSASHLRESPSFAAAVFTHRFALRIHGTIGGMLQLLVQSRIGCTA